MKKRDYIVHSISSSLTYSLTHSFIHSIAIPPLSWLLLKHFQLVACVTVVAGRVGAGPPHVLPVCSVQDVLVVLGALEVLLELLGAKVQPVSQFSDGGVFL